MTCRVSRPLADRFGDLTTGSVRLMPGWLRRVVPADMVGYLVLGVVTFAVDVVLLVLLDQLTSVPLPLCVAAADTLAGSGSLPLGLARRAIAGRP